MLDSLHHRRAYASLNPTRVVLLPTKWHSTVGQTPLNSTWRCTPTWQALVLRVHCFQAFPTFVTLALCSILLCCTTICVGRVCIHQAAVGNIPTWSGLSRFCGCRFCHRKRRWKELRRSVLWVVCGILMHLSYGACDLVYGRSCVSETLQCFRVFIVKLWIFNFVKAMHKLVVTNCALKWVVSSSNSGGLILGLVCLWPSVHVSGVTITLVWGIYVGGFGAIFKAFLSEELCVAGGMWMSMHNKHFVFQCRKRIQIEKNSSSSFVVVTLSAFVW